MVRGRFPNGIDPRLLHLTGTIVSWWSRIEGVLVKDLLTIRDHKSFKHKAANEALPVATKRLIDQWARGRRAIFSQDAKALEQLEKIVVELRNVAAERNDLVHGFWPYGAEPGERKLRLETFKPHPTKPGAFEIREYDIDAERLDEINERAISLYHKVMVMMINLLPIYTLPTRPYESE